MSVGFFTRSKVLLIAFAALCAVLTVLPSAAQAQTACDPQVQTIQSRFGQAMKIRNQGVTAQVVVRNDSALQLSCFDQAMALTSTAGQIFSDVFPSAGALASLLDVGTQPGVGSYAIPSWGVPPPIAALAALFGITLPVGKAGFQVPLPGPPPISSITLPIPGITNFLIFQINNTVEATLNSMMQQFVGNVMQQLFGYLASQMTLIMTTMFTSLLATYGLGSLASVLGVTIDLSGIMRTVMNSLFGRPSMLNCPTMATAWNNGVVGLGINGNTPYFTLNNFLGGAVSGTWAGAGGNMAIKYGTTANRNILIQANTDQGILVSPRPSHPPVPVLPPLPTVAQVISAM